MAYTKTERSAAAKKGWQGHNRRFWITKGVQPIRAVPVGKVKTPING